MASKPLATHSNGYNYPLDVASLDGVMRDSVDWRTRAPTWRALCGIEGESNCRSNGEQARDCNMLYSASVASCTNRVYNDVLSMTTVRKGLDLHRIDGAASPPRLARRHDVTCGLQAYSCCCSRHLSAPTKPQKSDDDHINGQNRCTGARGQ